MKKIGLCLALLLLLGCPALAGDVTVKLQVLQSSLVLGEPLPVVITVENSSQSALDLPFEPILAGMNPAVLVGTPGGQALTSSHGAPLACEEAHTNITASFPWKMGKDFDITIPAGKSVEFHSRLWLPISLRTKPGIYTLTPHYVARGTHPGQLGTVIGGPAPHPARQVGQGCWKGTVDGTAVQISLKAPTGIAAQAYQAFKGHPLKHPGELLKRFPTSTYAGYALRARIPALAREALTDLNNPDGTLRRWSDRGGSEATIQGHITKVQSAMRTYAQAAGAFLRAHPDFAYASEIRMGYAMCLGLTGHMPEAMTELQTLGEGTGREAEEAKAYLGEAPKKKSQKETPQTP